MNKIILSVSLLIGGLASAQIQVQSEPASNISQQNPFLDASGYNSYQNNIGKGLYFPKTDLTTWEFKTDVVSARTFRTYFDGMIVYNSGTGNTIADATKGGKQVAVTPGFYYFKNPNQSAPRGSVANGEWVRLGDDYTQLWAQRTNNGITETYLKPADANSDEYSYAKNRAFIRLGNIDTNLKGADGFIFNNVKETTPYSLFLNSSVLPNTENAVGPYGKFYPVFSREFYSIDNSYTPKIAERPKFRGKDIWLQAKGLTKPAEYLMGENVSVELLSSISTGSVIGSRFYSTVGDIDGTYTPTVTRNLGIQTFPNIHSGKVSKMVGTLNQPTIFGGTVDNLFGEETIVSTATLKPNQTTLPTQNLNDVVGNRLDISNRSNSTTQRLYGVLAYTNFEENSNITNDAAGFATSAYVGAGSTIKNYTGVVNYLDVSKGAANIENIYGFRMLNNLHADFTATNMYGLYLADVKKGTNNNYAIYTNAGNVRIGDLADASAAADRTIVVDKNGVLKVGTASGTTASKVGTTTGVECKEDNRGTMNFGRITINGKATDAIGFCMKNGDNEFRWYYIYGGAAHTVGTSAVFGSGL